MTSRTFDITGPLPGPGRTVLEASAGTGKTYAVAALATRFVAEAVVDLDQLLLITFSRAATAELRDRVRESFARTARALAREPQADDSELVSLLRAGSPTEVSRRVQRLRDALANYDAATIATTHEFCNAVLRSLGVAGNSDSSTRLLEDVTGLRDEVVGDLYLKRFLQSRDPEFDFRHAGRVATSVLDNSHAELYQDIAGLTDEEQVVAAARLGFASDARDAVARRKRRHSLITFDDMLSRLADALETDDSPAARRMRARWKVVIVDEFQDTDPVQWKVLDRAFGGSTGHDSRLILIGDPKQAIYAFRGGDTPTYLSAIAGADLQTLATNWRSDEPVVSGLQAFLGGASLGDGRILVHPVSAARSENRLHGLASGVRLRQLRREDFDAVGGLTKSGGIKAAHWREHVARDVAADIARTLSSGATWEGKPLTAGQIAILVSEHREVPPIQAELDRLGIASVVTAPQSVMTGPAAAEWLTLLSALEMPHRDPLVRATAIGCFFGHPAEDLVTRGDELTDTVAEQLRSWLDLFRTRGIAGVMGAVQSTGITARLLTQPGGERLVTDLFHIGQLLHEAAVQGRLGITGLLAWLREAIEEGNRTDARRRRLDVDAEAVQFVTIHGAKGLEYPIVHLPFLFDRSSRDWATIHNFHVGDVRMIDVSNTPEGKQRAAVEDAQERLRMAYVAMTRASAQLVMWWAPTWNAKHGSLSRLLFGRQPGESEVELEAPIPGNDAEIDAILSRWAARGSFRVEPSRIPDLPSQPAAPPPPPLAARPWTRELDLEWRRTSYSGLIRAEEQHSASPGATTGATEAEPEDAGTVDEDLPLTEEAVVSVARADVEGILSPMDGIYGGAVFGSLVHAVLEHADPHASDLRSELLGHIEEQRRWWDVEQDSETLADALLPMNHTPMGPLVGHRTLVEFGMADRLRELDFEFPMAGGDRAGEGAGLPLQTVAELMRAHLPEDDPVLPYAERLENPSLGHQVLRGYLSGSIDVVLRVRDGDEQRFVVVDYKTNSLGTLGEPMTTADYTPDHVAAAMVHSHYPLQAMLYSVVLHRFLRWRLPDYDPARHLGGVLYLYVRGMVGAETPVIDGMPCGVFSWQPPVALIEALSELLDGRAIGEGAA